MLIYSGLGFLERFQDITFSNYITSDSLNSTSTISPILQFNTLQIRPSVSKLTDPPLLIVASVEGLSLALTARSFFFSLLSISNFQSLLNENDIIIIYRIFEIFIFYYIIIF